MPCWETTAVTLDLEAANRGLLVTALQSIPGVESANAVTTTTGTTEVYALGREAGVRYTLAIADGQATVSSLSRQAADGLIGKIKTAYATEAIKLAAKKYSWMLQTDKTAANSFIATKRA